MSEEGVTLRDYFNQRFADSDKAVAAALAAVKEQTASTLASQKEATAAALASSKEAIIKAEHAYDKRFEGVNEFRNTLADQQRTLMPRAEVELIVKGLTERLKVLEEASIKRVGEGGGAKNLWAVIVGVIGVIAIVIGLLARFIK